MGNAGDFLLGIVVIVVGGGRGVGWVVVDMVALVVGFRGSAAEEEAGCVASLFLPLSS